MSPRPGVRDASLRDAPHREEEFASIGSSGVFAPPSGACRRSATTGVSKDGRLALESKTCKRRICHHWNRCAFPVGFVLPASPSWPTPFRDRIARSAVAVHCY